MSEAACAGVSDDEVSVSLLELTPCLSVSGIADAREQGRSGYLRIHDGSPPRRITGAIPEASNLVGRKSSAPALEPPTGAMNHDDERT
jgi:hypothetical protein